MTKLKYNPFTDSFDYVNKNSDFAISGLKDFDNSPTRYDGDKIVWDATSGKWLPYNEWIDCGKSNTSYYFYIDAQTGTFIFDGGSA
jgi:hypothetical protein